MHIAIDALLIYGEFSGVQHTIVHQIRGLLNRNTRHHFTIIALEDVQLPAILGTTRQPYSILRAPVASEQRLWRLIWQQVTMPERLHTMGIDVLYAPGYLAPLRWQGASVVFIHDTIALSHPELCTLSNALNYRLLLPPTARKATCVVVPSQASAQDVMHYCGVDPARIQVVPLGVAPPPALSPSDVAVTREKLQLPQQYILAVSTIEPKKNHDNLIRWFTAWKEAGIPHHLVIAGKWGWKTEAVRQALQDSPYQAYIHFPGYLPQHELPALMRGADLLVMPSRYEGFGLPVLEAMAVGTPVVVSDRGALPETVGDAGVILPLEDAAWQKTIPHLLQDTPSLSAFRAKGLLRAGEHTWQRTADQLMTIIEAVAPPERERRYRAADVKVDYE